MIQLKIERDLLLGTLLALALGTVFFAGMLFFGRNGLGICGPTAGFGFLILGSGTGFIQWAYILPLGGYLGKRGRAGFKRGLFVGALTVLVGNVLFLLGIWAFLIKSQ